MILGPESESKFLSAGVTVWSPKFSESGDRVRVRQKNNDSAFLAATLCKVDYILLQNEQSRRLLCCK